MFRAVFVFFGILPLPQPSPVLLRRRCQNSGVTAAVHNSNIEDAISSYMKFQFHLAYMDKSLPCITVTT